MKVNEILELLQQNIPLLSKTQRDKCLAALEEGPEVAGNGLPSVLAEAQPECCPHCRHDKLGKWGYASGLRRWVCKGCDKTFNILTKTPLARLRKKEKWNDNANAMIAGKSVRDTAEDCEVSIPTAFRWRHRFLDFPQRAQHSNLTGIAESDVTYFYRSEKGKKKLDRKPRKRGGDGIGPGLSHDLVPVVTLRDRSGKGADRVAVTNLRLHAFDLYQVHLNDDTLLITDGDTELCAAARERNSKAHLPLPGKESRGCGKSPYHIQTTNSFHGNLKSWMRRFNGVATKYLANYVGWHRHLAEGTHNKDPNSFIALSFNPLSICQQLMLT